MSDSDEELREKLRQSYLDIPVAKQLKESEQLKKQEEDKKRGKAKTHSPAASFMWWLGFLCFLISSLTIFFGDYFWTKEVGRYGERVIVFAMMFKLAVALIIGISLMLFSKLYDIRVYLDKSTKS